MPHFVTLPPVGGESSSTITRLRRAFIIVALCLAAGPLLAQSWTFHGVSPTPTPSPTPPATPVWVDDIIVDNPEAEFAGVWTTGSASADKYGTDYRFAYKGDGSGSGTFRPALPYTGDYEVFEWHPQGGNRATDAQILLYDGITQTSHLVNQQSSGGKWNSLGVYTLPAGSTAYARITNLFAGGDVVMADAFKFAYRTTAPSPTPTVTPSPSPTFTGTVRPFGEYVQEVIDELNYRKEHDVAGYLMKDLWGKYTGVTETLWYKNTSYMWNECAKDEWVNIGGSLYQPYGHSYCSGLTLEIFHRAMKKRDADMGIAQSAESWNGLGAKGIFIFKKLWNVVVIRYSDTGELVTNKPSPATALEMSGLGYIITYGDATKFENVKKYDFCDISRTTGTGHSVIFDQWTRDPGDNHITGLRYYSTQNSTDGQGYATEYFSGDGGTVSKVYFHAARAYDNPNEWTANTIREAGYQ